MPTSLDFSSSYPIATPPLDNHHLSLSISLSPTSSSPSNSAPIRDTYKALDPLLVTTLPMVTRSKARIFKPNAYHALQHTTIEPTNF